jgi:hypothetical protein
MVPVLGRFAKEFFHASSAAGSHEIGLIAQICAAGRQTVPPTVSASTRNVGWPTPTGTDWPS